MNGIFSIMILGPATGQLQKQGRKARNCRSKGINIVSASPLPKKKGHLQMANWRELLMMVQKSGVHQLRLVFEIPLSTVGFLNPRWFSRRISETSEVTRNAVEMDWTWKKSDCESFRTKPTIFFLEFWGKVVKISKKAIRFRSCDGTSTFDIKLNAIVLLFSTTWIHKIHRPEAPRRNCLAKVVLRSPIIRFHLGSWGMRLSTVRKS